MKNAIFISENAIGSFDLTKADRVSGGIINPVIPGGAVVEVHFKGATTTQVLSTANSGEITLTDAANGLIAYAMPTSKSALLQAGQGLPVDVLVTASGKTYVYEFFSGVDVSPVANP